MKKLLTVLLVALGLQIQAQVNYCDSIGYSIQSFSGSTSITLIAIANAQGIISWNWLAHDNNLYYPDSGSLVTFNQFNALDTVEICYTVVIEDFITGCVYVCHNCDSLVYNSFGVWTFLRTTNPVAIKETAYTGSLNGKMYDLLGREFRNYNVIPSGAMYIKNRKKYIK